MLGLLIRIPPEAWLFVLSFVCCQDNHSFRGVLPSVVCLSVDKTMKRLWPARGCCIMGGNHLLGSSDFQNYIESGRHLFRTVS